MNSRIIMIGGRAKILNALRSKTFLCASASLCCLAAAAPARDIVTLDARATDADRSIGVKVDLLSAVSAKRPTKTVYVEEAVALWKPAHGQMIASTAAGEADITAAVDAREEEQPIGVGEAVADHFRRNAGKYVASALAAAVAGGAYAIYDHQQSDSPAKPATAPVPTTNNPQNSPTYIINTGDNSPVTITAPQTAMPPE